MSTETERSACLTAAEEAELEQRFGQARALRGAADLLTDLEKAIGWLRELSTNDRRISETSMQLINGFLARHRT